MMKPFVFKSWGDAETATTKQMWWDGHTAQEICVAVNATSPRAVKEKVLRSGFVRNPDLGMDQPYEIPVIMLPQPREDGELVTIANVKSKECRVIYGDERLLDAPMCGRPIKRGSYCEEHCKVLFQKEQKVA